MSKARDLASLLGGGSSGAITFGGTAAVRVPNGTTAERPTPAAGMIRYNTTTGFAEVYDGNVWADFGAPPPSISTVTPSTYNGESGTTFTINGTNFTSDATVYFVTSGGTEVQAGTVSFVSGVQLTATTPQDFTVADEPLDVKVVQASGQVTKLDVIDCGGSPTWSTASGQIGSDSYEGDSFSETVSASDPDAGATITYSVSSGSLPTGLSLNTSTGVISGTSPQVSGTTTTNFSLTATDNAGNATARAFSIVVKDAYSKTNLWYDFDAADTNLSDGATISASSIITDRTPSSASTSTSGGTTTYRTANGGYFEYGGSNYFLVTGHSSWSTLSSAPSLSLVCWCQTNGASRQAIISRWASGFNQWNHMFDSGGHYHYNSDSIISGATGSVYPGSWANNTWMLTVWTYNVSDGYARWYENNGTQVASVSFGTNSGNGLGTGGSSSAQIGIGTRADGNTQSLVGKLAIARIYTRALSASDIQIEYAQFKSRFGLS